ncbi:MAG: FtsX-like permease family protein [Planctomycetes bacterium]|nr:FtsX-like permease family protein [Planctomycetota bacterium]
MLVGASVAGSGMESMIEIDESMIDFFTVVLEIIFSIIVGIILVAAGFLIFNAFAMSVLQRNKQIGMMRALGSSPKQIRQQLLAESFMVGGLGSLIGIAIGPFLGRLVLEMMVYFGAGVGKGSVSLRSIVLAIVMGIGISLLAVLVPARRATQISPMAAIRQDEAEGGRVLKKVLRRKKNGQNNWIIFIISTAKPAWCCPAAQDITRCDF